MLIIMGFNNENTNTSLSNITSEAELYRLKNLGQMIGDYFFQTPESKIKRQYEIEVFQRAAKARLEVDTLKIDEIVAKEQIASNGRMRVLKTQEVAQISIDEDNATYEMNFAIQRVLENDSFTEENKRQRIAKIQQRFNALIDTF